MRTTLFLLCAFFGQAALAAPQAAQEVTVPREKREAVRPAVPASLRPIERLIEQADTRVMKGRRARTNSQSLAVFRRAERTYELALTRHGRKSVRIDGERAALAGLSYVYREQKREAA